VKVLTIRTATATLVEAAEAFTEWYRRGGNWESRDSQRMLNELAHATEAHRACIEREHQRLVAEDLA
jgi:hypothetical protein